MSQREDDSPGPRRSRGPRAHDHLVEPMYSALRPPDEDPDPFAPRAEPGRLQRAAVPVWWILAGTLTLGIGLVWVARG